MTVQAAAVFAQVIPVLFVAAFLSGVRIARRGDGTTLAAMTYLSLAAAAEAVCLFSVMVDYPLPAWVSALVGGVAGIQLIAVVATTYTGLKNQEQDVEQDRSLKHD